jgi:hypothetical protein
MVRKDPRSKTVSGLMLDVEGNIPTHFVKGGIAYETQTTIQPIIRMLTGVEVSLSLSLSLSLSRDTALLLTY